MKKKILITLLTIMTGITFNQAQAQTEDLIFVGVQPCRIANSRKSSSGFPLTPGQPQNLLVTGTAAELFDQRGSVTGGAAGCPNPRPGVAPAAIAAYIIAVAPDEGSSDGVLFAYPATSTGAIPASGTGSTINFTKDQDVGNSTTITLCTPGDCPADGSFAILARNTTEHVVVDVLGYYYPAGLSGYVWADQPTATSYVPSGTYSFNSSGGANTITRVDTGVYEVTFAGLGINGNRFSGGNVQVTKYDNGAGICHVDRWSGSPDLVVHVNCYDMSGVPTDHMYTVLFNWK